MKKAFVRCSSFALFVFCMAACTGPIGPQGATGASGSDGEDTSALNYVLTPSALAANGSCYGSGSIVSVGDNGLAAYKTAGTSWSDVVAVSGS